MLQHILAKQDISANAHSRRFARIKTYLIDTKLNPTNMACLNKE